MKVEGARQSQSPKLSRVGVFVVHYFMLKKYKKCRQGMNKEEADLFRESEKNIAVGSAVLREGVLLSCLV